jgi:NAD(P)-dependent dehydrogenase (short-subunit alcohol dehydrogenase family)
MPFGFETTADEVLAGVDLSGRTMLVTGANSGIGLETARALGAAGAKVVVTARDEGKCAQMLKALAAAAPEAEFEAAALELGSLASVRACADRLLERHPRLDVLLNNAGVMNTPFGRTEDGFETQFGVDHLGHFVLTGRLAPSLLAGAPARVVCVSSAAHVRSDIRWDDVNWEQAPYDMFAAYGQAKTANILFALELDRRLGGRGVRALSLNPGGVQTGLARYMTPADLEKMTEAYQGAPVGHTPASRFRFKSIAQGAATSVWAAVSPALAGLGGIYLQDCQIAGPAGPGQGGYMPYAIDPAKAARLWEISEKMVGERFALG